MIAGFLGSRGIAPKKHPWEGVVESRVWLSFAFLFVGMVLALEACRQTETTEPPLLVITGATLIDGTGAEAVADSVVVIRGDRIAAAGPRSRVGVPKGARVLDARGKWIIPGLVDAHVHFFQSGGLYTRPDVIDLRDRVPYEQELEEIRQRLPQIFRRYLCAGVTSVVDVGGPMWNFKVRDMATRTEAAPRVAVAGPLVSMYSPEALQTDDPAIIRVQNPEEARALVRHQVAEKPDLVKIWFIRLPDTKLEESLPLVEATIQEAHAHGVRVAVHATELETAKAAVRAGCDILVHGVDDEAVDHEFIQMVRDRGVIYTSSIVVFEGYDKVLGEKVSLTDIDVACGDPAVITTWAELAEVPEEKRPQRPDWVDRAIATVPVNLKRMQEAGGIVAVGTDAGNIGTLHGPAIHREFELMAEAGLTPMEILLAATRNAALVFSSDPEFGIIEPGKLADLVILDADPLADIRNARKITKVIKGGRVFDHASLVLSF